MSSITATPSRKATSAVGTRRPRAASAHSAKATSVAIGMPQPREPASPPITARKIKAGRTIPPIAANTGSRAACRVESSPTSSSRFTSRPTTKKKIAIRPSLTRWRRSSART